MLDIRIIRETSEIRRGEIAAVVSPGPARATPPCPHFADCGGCLLQQFSPEYYHAFKRRMFHSALALAGLSAPDAEVTFLPAASRRRAELQVTPAALAFYAPGSHRLVPIENCLILEPPLQALLAPLAQVLGTFESIRSVALTAADSGIDILLECSALPGGPAAFAAIAEALGVARIGARLPGGGLHTLAERAPVEMTLGGYAVALPANAFLQASREGQAILTQTVMNALKGRKSVADLFCGIGTYSFPLSHEAKVHAVESDPGMVEALRQSINRHTLGAMLTAERRDLFKTPLTAKELSRFEGAVLNPPRTGARAQAEELAKSAVSAVVMVSCNQASFARDARILAGGGFTLAQAGAIDQFVYSPHLEIVAVFRR